MIAIKVTMWLVILCSVRKNEGKDLAKASKIVSMPEVRKFKLEMSGKQQQEVDVDLEVPFDDLTPGNGTSAAANTTPEVVSADAHQKSKRKSEMSKKEESTQSSFTKQKISNKGTQSSRPSSRITKGLQEKQWERPFGDNEVLLFLFHFT
uniref:Uncharacterized protein n=1 Tax=Elaeophora elaphi TaxID=1147741 RepID=A0A0R3RRZ6_9BILA